MSKYSEYVARGQARYANGMPGVVDSTFSASGLALEFVPYFNSGERVRVRFSYGEELTGTIGATTGWRPCFLLMRTSRSIGSLYTLGDKDHVVAVKRGRSYVPVLRRSA